MEMRRMNREINQMAKKDKQNHLIEQFKDNHKIETTRIFGKQLKAYGPSLPHRSPQYVQIKKERGVHVPLTKGLKQ